MAEWNLQRIYTSRVVLYRVSTGCRSDITSVVLRRTRYSALVYVTERRRIGHTVAPILEVEHRWYRHQRSAAETVTDIPAECTRSSTPGKFAKLFGPSFQIKEYTYLSISFFFFFSFQYRHQCVKTNSLSFESSNYKSKRESIVKTRFYFSSRTVRTFVSQRYPIARQSKRTRSYPSTVTTHNRSILFNSVRIEKLSHLSL